MYFYFKAQQYDLRTVIVDMRSSSHWKYNNILVYGVYDLAISDIN